MLFTVNLIVYWCFVAVNIVVQMISLSSLLWNCPLHKKQISFLCIASTSQRQQGVLWRVITLPLPETELSIFVENQIVSLVMEISLVS